MPYSKQQVKLAYAVLAGKSNAMPKSVAREMVSKWESMSKADRKKMPRKK